MLFDGYFTAARQFALTGEPQRVFGSFAYSASTWDRARKVIVKAEHTAKGANPRFVVTNVPGQAEELYEDVYCERSEASRGQTRFPVFDRPTESQEELGRVR